MRTLYLGLCTFVLLSFSSRLAGQAIVSVEENGRRVWTNEGTPATPRAAAPRASHIVYWSRAERRWKAVPMANSAEMRSAQSVIAEVRQSLAARPQRAGIAHTLRTSSATPAEVDSAIELAAARHNVDPNLVRAVIKVESNFNPQAVSRKGAVGLMQLMPSTARGLSVTDPFDPQQNIDGGVRHLKQLLENFNGNVPLSLAAYNAGEGAVSRSNGIPQYRETQKYVRQITNLYWGGNSTEGR